MNRFLFVILCVFALATFAGNGHAKIEIYDGSADHELFSKEKRDPIYDYKTVVDNYDGQYHAEKKGGLPQLNAKWYPTQIFWLALSFMIMYTVFRFKVLPDLSSAVESRQEKIQKDLEAAHSLKEQAEKTHAEYEQILSDARVKSSMLYERVETKIKDKEQEEYSKFYAKSAKQLADTEAEIITAKKAAVKDVNKVVADVAVVAAKKIVGLSASDKDAEKVVDLIRKKKAA